MRIVQYAKGLPQTLARGPSGELKWQSTGEVLSLRDSWLRLQAASGRTLLASVTSTVLDAQGLSCLAVKAVAPWNLVLKDAIEDIGTASEVFTGSRDAAH